VLHQFFHGIIQTGRSGASTVGANAHVFGDLRAGNGVITTGESAQVKPCGQLSAGANNDNVLSSQYGPGSHNVGTNIVAGGVINLSGQGSYRFSGGALTTGANSRIVLSNGARCSDVEWELQTFTSGANSLMIGAVHAETATLGANSRIQGSMQANTLTRGEQSSVVGCGQLSAAANSNGQRIEAELGGQTLTSGSYNADATAFGLTGTLILSGPGVYNFNTPAALNTAAASNVQLVNGARCSDVHWNIGAAATLGASSVFQGMIQTGRSGAITVGANANVYGDLKAGNGVVSMGESAQVKPCSGMLGSVLALQYSPGSYNVGTNIAAGAIVTLSGQGRYVFSGGALTTGADSVIKLTNGAKCSDVEWQLKTFTSGANSLMIGAVHAETATLGANSRIQGSIQANVVNHGDQSSVVVC